jgi:hypothetical protein
MQSGNGIEIVESLSIGNTLSTHLLTNYRAYMKMLSIICFVFLFASCKTKPQPVPETKVEFSDTASLSNDSLAFYFPAKSFHDKLSSDSFVQNWYGSALYSCKEPILSRSYLGHEIYRFLWLRSFHRPVVFALHKSNNQVWLSTKMLDKQPRFYVERIGGITKEYREDYIKRGYIIDNFIPDRVVRFPDRKANIIYSKDTMLSENVWKGFESLLEKASFWRLPSRIDDGSTDGAQWIIEGHLKNRYHFVDFHSPDGDFAKLGLYLIKLSKLKEEIY